MSAGTRSRAITATAPASSAIFACSGVTTSMITPPLSMSARPRLTPPVPVAGTGSGLVTVVPPGTCDSDSPDRTGRGRGSVDRERYRSRLERARSGEELGQLVGMDDVEGHRELGAGPPAVPLHGARRVLGEAPGVDVA